MRTDAQKPFELQAKFKKQISLSLKRIILPVISEEDESIAKYENKQCTLVKQRIRMLPKLNKIHGNKIGKGYSSQ